MNSRLNLLSRFEDVIDPSQLSFWINASPSLKTKDNNVKASAKVTTSQNQTDNTTQGKASSEITPYHAKAKSASRISSKCNQKLKVILKLRNLLLSITSLIMNRQVNGKIVHFLCYIFVAMDKILQEIKNLEERLQTRIEDLEGRFGQCDGFTKRKISPPPEVRVSYFYVLRQSEKFNSFYSTTT